MRFAFTEAQEQFRQEIRAFCAQEMTPEMIARLEAQGEIANAHSPELYKKMADRGWLGVQWPKEYGGEGKSQVEMAIFNEEAGYYQVPMTGYALTVNVVGNSFITFGTEEQKQEYLPRIARGEILFCQGFSEPGSGSDLASLQTQAVEDGDEYVIHGQKIFTTNAHLADYIFLLARTDANVPKHKGLSLFVVPMQAPGVAVRPLYTLGGGRVNQTFFEAVRIPRKNLIGEKNRGWYHATATLDFERSGAGRVGQARRILEGLIQYTKETTRHGHTLSKEPLIRQKLTQMAIELEVVRLIAYRVASMQSRGLIPNYEASMSKVYGSEYLKRLANVGMEIFGPYAPLQRGSKWAPLQGKMEALTRGAMGGTIAAGTSEIQRYIIAGRGLGLPR
jgi:alkylation response protein AidB-like acyl-CoA dehydrogenase